MIDKEYWAKWWINLQHDIGDVLQNNLLNFSTLVLMIKIYFETFHPEYVKVVGGFVDGFLLVSGKGAIDKVLNKI